MKTLKNLPTYPQDSNIKFPFGNIINETELQPGTPVTRELLGDFITNFYKILELTNTIPNSIEDNDETEYQLIDAIKKLPNSLNDVNRTLGYINEISFSVNLNFSTLPDNYFFFGEIPANYNLKKSYSIQDSDGSIFDLFSDFNIQENSKCLFFVLPSNQTCFVYDLAYNTKVTSEVFLTGTPISYNDTQYIYYFENGYLRSDYPNAMNLQSNLDLLYSNLEIIDVWIFQSYVLILTIDTISEVYSFKQTTITDALDIIDVNTIGFTFPSGINNNPYFVFQVNSISNPFIYSTNNCGNDILDNKIAKLSLNFQTNEITKLSENTISSGFVKTSNMVCKNNVLYTLINGEMKTFNLITGIENVYDIFKCDQVSQLFLFDDKIFNSVGEIAKKLIL